MPAAAPAAGDGGTATGAAARVLAAFTSRPAIISAKTSPYSTATWFDQ